MVIIQEVGQKVWVGMLIVVVNVKVDVQAIKTVV